MFRIKGVGPRIFLISRAVAPIGIRKRDTFPLGVLKN